MKTKSLLYPLALGAVTVRAQSTTVNVTDLLNWPPCAQNCIPLGFQPPANCESLSDLTCVCKGTDFSAQIDSCEDRTCSIEERTQIRELSVQLCRPVGGYASKTISPALSSLEATAAPYPTSTPGLDPANILSYPKCAQICGNETAAPDSIPCGASDINCACSADFRAITAACERITCSGNDYNQTQRLAEQLCAPVYSASSLLGPSVTSAIASQTSVFASAVATRDAANPKTWPTCSKGCLDQYLPQSGCNSLSNRTCVCQTSKIDQTTFPCFAISCIPEDQTIITALLLVLCNPVGGVGNGSNASISASVPSPSAFVGGAPVIAADLWSGLWLGMGMVGLMAGLLT